VTSTDDIFGTRRVEQALDGRLTRGELSAVISRIWKVRDLIGRDRLPGAIANLVLACLSDVYRVDDANFVHAVREAHQALG